MPKNSTTHHKKQFDAWNKVKRNINRRAKVPTIHEGEVWWFADGQNVGVEIDGKGHDFARPVLILTKFGRLSFLGIPLTTKKHNGTWYVEYDFQGKICYAALHQARAISVYRLYRKMGEMTRRDQKRVRSAFLRMHGKKYSLYHQVEVLWVFPKIILLYTGFSKKSRIFCQNFLPKSVKNGQNSA